MNRDWLWGALSCVAVLLFLWPTTWAVTRIVIDDGRLVEAVEPDSASWQHQVDRYLEVKYLLDQCEFTRDSLDYQAQKWEIRARAK